MLKYKRILLKLSGEALMGEQQYGIDDVRLNQYAAQIREAVELGVQVAIVVGGGNIFRGVSGMNQGVDRLNGDQMGMLATVINSLAISSTLTGHGIQSKVYTAFQMQPVGELFCKQKAIQSLASGEVVIVSAGTGNPYFTTDTAAALRGLELGADVMMKGTRVDGVYTADPEKDPNAEKFDTISFDELYARQSGIMDLTATTMCRENHLNVVVFDMNKEGNLIKLLKGEKIGTFVYS